MERGTVPLDAVLVVGVGWRSDVDSASAGVVVVNPAQVAACLPFNAENSMELAHVKRRPGLTRLGHTEEELFVPVVVGATACNVG